MLINSHSSGKTRSQMMVDHLWDLKASSPQIEASALVSVDGLPLASALPPGIEEDRLSAMSASVLALSERISTELVCGALNQVFIQGDDGYIILLAVGRNAVLTAQTRDKAKLGLVYHEMRRTADALGQLISI